MSGAAQKSQGARPKVHKDNLQPSSKTADTSSSTDNAAASAADEDGDDNHPEASGGGSDRSAGSPEPNCAICLGALENKSFTDSCFHMFCFVCLQEWSKVKPECPLCKQPFKSIIHNVKSYNNYDQFYLEHHPPAAPPMRFGWNFDRSFRYRTTLTMDHRYILPPPALPHSHYRPAPMSPDTAMHRSLLYPSQLPRYYRSRRMRSLGSESVSTTNFRRGIYLSGRRVNGCRSSSRRRTITPEFFRSNPAQTHRLVPWLNRELNALLYSTETQVTFVLELIMDLIKRFAIDGDEFYEHIHPYLHDNTRHFMHEFLSFARSPYTMRTYDTKAVYEESSVTTLSNSDSSSSNSDVVVVDDDDAEEAGRPGQAGAMAAAVAGPSTPRRSPQFSGSLWEDQRFANFFNSSSTSMARSGWDSPTPGPSWDLGGTTSQLPVSVDTSSDSEASTIIDPTYIPQHTPDSRPQRSRSPGVSDGEDVIFVSYDKPWEERSPIQLSSGSDDEALSKFAKRLKREHKKKKKMRATVTCDSAGQHSRSRHRERSMTPPASPSDRSKSPHSRSSHRQDQPTCSGGRSKQRHPRKRHHDAAEELPRSSSRSSRREKRGHSAPSTHSESGHKKRRHERPDEDSAYMSSESRRKKHKHKKKHKKNKDKTSKSSKKRDVDGHPSGSSQKTSSSRAREEGDRCKKHPSGHKKTCARDSGDGNEREAGEGEGSNEHQNDALLCSDALLSDTGSGSSTSTTTSTTDTEPTSTSFSARQQRVHQVLQERCQASNPLSLPVFPGMEAATSWESITRLARLLASHSTTFPPTTSQGPSQFPSSSEPVVISTSSDDSDSDQETPCMRMETDGTMGSNMNVAKTVVVPCSSRMGVPTPAIDFTSAPSTSSSRPLVIDECIDVESISSDDESVVDVESLEDTEDSCTEPTSSGSTCEMSTNTAGTVGVTEISAEVVPSPVTLASLRTHTSATPAHPFSIQSILNRDVFMGVEPGSHPLSRQASTSSNLDAMVSSQDFTFSHSQPQSSEGLRNAGGDHCRSTHSGYVSKLDQLLPQRLLSQPSQDNSYQLEGLSLRSLFAQQSVESKESVDQNKDSRLNGQLLSPQSSTISQIEECLTDTDEEINVTFLDTETSQNACKTKIAKPASGPGKDQGSRNSGESEDEDSNHLVIVDAVEEEKAKHLASSSVNTTDVVEYSKAAECSDSAKGSSQVNQDGADRAPHTQAAVSLLQNSGDATLSYPLSAPPGSPECDFSTKSDQETDNRAEDAGDSALGAAAGVASVRNSLSETESDFSFENDDADTSCGEDIILSGRATDEVGHAISNITNTSVKGSLGDGGDGCVSADTVDYACTSAGDMWAEGVDSLLADVDNSVPSGVGKDGAQMCVESGRTSYSTTELEATVSQDCGTDKDVVKDTLNPSSDISDSTEIVAKVDLDKPVLSGKETACRTGAGSDSVDRDAHSDAGSSSADLDLGESDEDLESDGDLDTDECLSSLSSPQHDSNILTS